MPRNALTNCGLKFLATTLTLVFCLSSFRSTFAKLVNGKTDFSVSFFGKFSLEFFNFVLRPINVVDRNVVLNFWARL